MATLTIESNGRIDRTAVYYNGEQVAGIKELYLNLDEEGTIDAIIQYEGKDKQVHTKNVFTDHMDHLKVTEPSFTEEEAAELVNLTIESNGYIEDTMVFLDDIQEEGIVSVFVHIKAAESKGGIATLFKTKRKIDERPEFKAEIVYREEDDSLTTEAIFL